MRKYRNTKRLVAVFLTAILEFNTMGFAPLSEKTRESEFSFTPGHIESDFSAPILEKKPEQSLLKLLSSGSLPQSYSSVEEGNVTSIKNQGGLGTCWTFAAVAAMESYAITHGLVEGPDDIDLSEYALAFLTFADSSFTDATGTTESDITTTTDIYSGMAGGGNDNYIFKTLSKWAGVMNESDYAYDGTGRSVVNYDASKIKYILTNQYYINMANVEHIKKAIIENGAVTSYYNADDEYSNSTDEFYDYYHYTYEEVSSNHAIAIVGWDDTIAKENFTIFDANGGIHTPSNNGAWLIKNSWGTYWGDEGYMWISYEDKVMSQATACVYEIAPSTEYTYNYQHDGGNIFGYSIAFGSSKYANVFSMTGNKKQDIKAVSVGVEEANRDYSIQIYLNPTEDSPESGIQMLSTPVTGSITHPGYYTIPLPNAVTVEPEDTFSVVIEFDQATDVASAINGSVTIGGNGCANVVNTCGDNQSYVYWNNSYIDLYEYYDESSSFRVNFCIKAMAVDNTDEISATTITSVESVGLTGLKINWQKVKDGITYTLLRATSMNGEYTEVYTGTATSYTDTSVVKNTEYYYKVRVYNEQSEPLDSSVKTGKVVIPSTILRTTEDTTDGVVLSWDMIDAVDGYNIYRSTNGGGYVKIASVQNTDTYCDATAVCFNNYAYYVKSYIGTEEAVASNTISISRKVLNFTANNFVYDEIELSWENVENADGYIIYMGATDIYENYDPKEQIAEVFSGTNSYTVDISNLKRGQWVYFYIEAYVENDGAKVYCDTSVASLYLLYEPVENIKWYVNNNVIYVKWDEYTTGSNVLEYVLHGYNSPNAETITSTRLSTTTMVSVPAFSLNQTYYVTVCAKNALYTVFTKEQSPRVIVGGSYKPLQLNTIADVNFEKGDVVELKATLTNEMANFDYQYQWYETSSKTTTGTAIAGATSSVFRPNTSSDTKRYYYCVVSGVYNGSVQAMSNVITVKSNGYKEVVDVNNCTFSSISAQNYTGVAIKPAVTVSYNGKTLVNGTDYTLTYGNNVNVGMATIVITGKGNYTGTKTITFRINAVDVCNATISTIPNQIYTGNGIKPDFTVTYGGKLLIKDKDYTVNYSNNINVGFATLTIIGKGNYNGTQTRGFYIISNAPSAITSAVVTVNQESNIVSNIKPGTKTSTLISSVNEKQYAAVYSNGSKISADTAVGTGMQLCIVDNGKITRSYTIVVTGDTSGDGKVNITDLIAVKSHILKKSTLTGCKLSGGDTNGDGKVNITDFIKIKGYILKKNGI